jgi:hypothetical protein
MSRELSGIWLMLDFMRCIDVRPVGMSAHIFSKHVHRCYGSVLFVSSVSVQSADSVFPWYHFANARFRHTFLPADICRWSRLSLRIGLTALTLSLKEVIVAAILPTPR